MAGTHTQEFTEANFDAEVYKATEPVLVDFWAEWCMPCRALGPTIDELGAQYAGKAKVGKLNVDHHQNLAAKLQVSSIPTVMIFNKGQVVEKIIGLHNKKDYARILDGLLKD